MVSRNLFRRLELLEAHLIPTSPRLVEIRVMSVATGEIIQRILMPRDDDRRRGRRTRQWQQKAYEVGRQTTA
jgi:hypothetical protein